MGVAGSGKTTVGQRLARELGWDFADGDDYHPTANVEKMARGEPLTDADREPWLARLRALVAEWVREGKSGVLACSALKERYRQELTISPEVRIVFLKAEPDLLRERLRHRAGHYMKAGMLDSQLETLEDPEDALIVDVSSPVEEVVAEIRRGLGTG